MRIASNRTVLLRRQFLRKAEVYFWNRIYEKLLFNDNMRMESLHSTLVSRTKKIVESNGYKRIFYRIIFGILCWCHIHTFLTKIR